MYLFNLLAHSPIWWQNTVKHNILFLMAIFTILWAIYVFFDLAKNVKINGENGRVFRLSFGFTEKL